jgi:hypothetical protein
MIYKLLRSGNINQSRKKFDGRVLELEYKTMMLMNFETKYKYYFCSYILNFVYFSLIFVLTTYSLKQGVIAQGDQKICEGVSLRWSAMRHRNPFLLGVLQAGANGLSC